MILQEWKSLNHEFVDHRLDHGLVILVILGALDALGAFGTLGILGVDALPFFFW